MTSEKKVSPDGSAYASSPSSAFANSLESASSCCTAFYQLEWVNELAQSCFHPGGAELTARTIQAMNLSRGARLLDVGCGAGQSAVQAARRHRLNVTAIDLGVANLVRAQETVSSKIQDAKIQGGRRVSTPGFTVANATALPFGAASFDGLTAECSFSLIPDQQQALSEFQRVLRPCGKLGITDMAIEGTIAPDLSAVITPWTCLQDARSEQDYREQFASAGFELDEFEDASTGLLQMVDQLKRRLLLVTAGLLLRGNTGTPIPVEEIRHWMERFREEVIAGRVRYLRFNLRRLNSGG